MFFANTIFNTVIVLAACAVAHGQTNCGLYDSECSSCVEASGCGWAADAHSCYDGTFSGPNYPYSSTDWIWGSDANCPCSSEDICESCSSLPLCVWDGNSCEDAGTAVAQACSGSSSTSGCSAYATCAACADQASCVWDGSSCVVTGSNPPTSCPGSNAECSFSECSSCVAAPGCGWAADAHSCYDGTFSGPNYPDSSTDWIWGSDANCPCSSEDSCESCSSLPLCVWDGNSCENAGTVVAQACSGSSSAGAPSGIEPTSGLGLDIILVIVLVPAGVLTMTTAAACLWYRRVIALRRAAAAAATIGLTEGMLTPDDAVHTEPGINTAV